MVVSVGVVGGVCMQVSRVQGGTLMMHILLHPRSHSWGWAPFGVTPQKLGLVVGFPMVLDIP